LIAVFEWIKTYGAHWILISAARHRKSRERQILERHNIQWQVLYKQTINNITKKECRKASLGTFCGITRLEIKLRREEKELESLFVLSHAWAAGA
jgi:hypothetical protein